MEPNSMIILGIVLLVIGLTILFGGMLLLGLWRRNMQNEMQQGHPEI